MLSVSRFCPRCSLFFFFSGFEWGLLPKNSVVVDVGGGVGMATLSVAKVFPDLRIVIQDRPKFVEDARKVSI